MDLMVTLSIVAMAILVILSGMFSATETSFTSASKIKLMKIEEEGNKKATKTIHLLENYDKLLTTILVGNNLVNIMSSSLCTFIFTEMFGAMGVMISTVFMLVVILAVGEITPKSLAKSAPEKFALFFTPFISIVAKIFSPITWVFQKFSSIVNKCANTGEDTPTLTEEELMIMVDEIEEEGELEEAESDLIKSAIRFDDKCVSEILTPRVDIVGIEKRATMDEVKKLFIRSGFSRLPVYEDSIDNIIGVLIEKDFYYHLLYEKSTNIREVLKPVIYTSPQVKISSLLKQFQTSKSHMAIVVDEYGGTQGIITMEDILEELVGEIYDEHDRVIEYYKKLDDNTYLVKADEDIDEMFDHFAIENDEDYEFNTVSAWVIDILDKIPVKGDSFDFRNMHVEVTDADSKKVNEIKITFKKEEEEKDK